MLDPNPERIRSALSHLSPHERPTWVMAAFAIRSELGDEGFDIWEDWGSAHKRPLSEVRATWRSAKAGKTKMGTLIMRAKEAGWKDDSTYKRPTKQQIAERNAKRAARDEAEREEEAAMHQAAAAKAQALWDAAAPATTHPYLTRKGVQSHGLRYGKFDIERIDEDTGEIIVRQMDALLVPVRDKSKKIWTLQAISSRPDGGKLLLGGGKKSGNFAAVGDKPLPHAGQPVFVLAEGYASAASVHEATGHLVLACVDAGNLMAVARQIRDAKPAAVLLFAADNDQGRDDGSNPGLEAATKAAQAVGGLVAIPTLSSEPGKACDFNDLHQAEGLEAVSGVIDNALGPAPTEPAPPPVQPQAAAPQAPAMPAQPADKDDPLTNNGHFSILGYDQDTYYFFHREKKQVLRRTAGQFSEMGLIELAPIEWWEMNGFIDSKGNKGGIDRLAAAAWIFDVAHKRSMYDERRVRGRGAWNDNGRVVFHHGDYLWVDGKKVDISEIKSRWIYPLGSSMPDPAPTPATDAEGQHLLDLMKLARWTRPGSAPLLVGWVLLSMVCGALPWRPHVWLTGPAGSGKSTIQEEFVQGLLSGISESFNGGDSTAPGIRQKLQADALPAIIDEFEPNEEGDRKRMRDILTMARQASSESSARTVKGTVSGEGMEFHVRSMFCFASISTMLDKDSDSGRITPLSLKNAARSGSPDDHWQELKAGLAAIKKDGKWPTRILARALGMLPAILANVEVFRNAAATRFGHARTGDQYGTLLAGAWSLTSSAVATPAQAVEMIDSYDWTEHRGSGDGMDDPTKALAAILEAKIKVSYNDVSVYELIAEAVGRRQTMNEIGAEMCRDVLVRNGIRIQEGHVFFGSGSKNLQALVKDSPYATDLRGQLRRIEGAHVYDDRTLKFSGVTSKVVAIPVNSVHILGEIEPPI